jgi:hypothetical protein
MGNLPQTDGTLANDQTRPRGKSVPGDLEGARGRPGKNQDPRIPRLPVVDPHIDHPARLEVRDPDDGSKGKSGMRRSERRTVVGFPARGAVSLEGIRVDTESTALTLL